MGKLTFVGYDDWSRALFKEECMRTLVDVDGELHTMTPNWGEPLSSTGIRTPEIKGEDE